MSDEPAGSEPIAPRCNETQRHVAALLRQLDDAAVTRLTDSLPDGFALFDSAGVVLSVNPALCALTGRTEQELVGTRPPFPCWPPGQEEAFSAAMAATLSGDVRPREFLLLRKGGERVPVLITPSVFRDDAGTVVSVSILFRDLGERRRTETALAESEDLFRLAFDQAPIGAALFAGDTFKRVNGALCSLLGYTREELLTLNFLQITHPDDLEVSAETARRLSEGMTERLSLEKRYLRKDGREVWAKTVVRPVRDAAERVVAHFAMIDDITAQKRAVEELRLSDQRLRTVLDAAHEGIILQARDGTVLTFNRAAGEVFGVSETEVVGQSALGRDWETIYEDGTPWPPHEHPTMLAMRSGEPVTDLVIGVVRGDETRWLTASAHPIVPEGEKEAVAAVVSFKDETDRLRAERAVAEAQRLLIETQEISRLGGWEYDVAADRFTWTEQVYRTYGVDLDFDVNDLRRNIGFYAPEDQAVIDAAFAGILETGAPYDLELRFRPAGADHPIWVRTIARAEMRDGEVVRVIGNLMDVDERKQAEVALVAERERAQTYLDLAGVMIVAVGADGVVSVANRKACEVLERQESDIVGRDWFRLAIPDDARATVRQVFDGLLCGEPTPLDFFENEVVTASGGRRLIAWHNVLLRDADGSVTGTLSSGEDITERKRAEQALREAEERYRSLFAQSPIPVWEEDLSAVRDWFDAQRDVDDWGAYFDAHPEHVVTCAGLVRVQSSNRAGLDLFGVDSAEDLALTLPRYFTEESYPAFRDELVALAGGDTQYAAEIPITDLAENRRVLDLHLNVVPGHEARLDRVLVSFSDVTERRAAEAEIRRLNEELQERIVSRTEQMDAATRELEALAYSIAHDVRAPLRIIDGFSAAVLEDETGRLNDEGVTALRRVRGAAQTLARLLDDLMGLSHVSRRDLVRQSVDLSALAADVGDECAGDHPSRQVELTVTPGLAAVADPNLVRLIFRELLGNAWKFTAPNPAAHVEVGALDAGGERAFFVRDDGVGFDMRYAEHLFGIFQRMHPPGQFEGDGVGLATVQRLVRRHGGRAWAESEPGRGTMVCFTLPDEDDRR